MTILAKQQRDRYQREIVKLDKEYEKLKESGNLLKVNSYSFVNQFYSFI